MVWIRIPFTMHVYIHYHPLVTFIFHGHVYLGQDLVFIELSNPFEFSAANASIGMF